MNQSNTQKLSVSGSVNKSSWVSAMTLGDMFDQTAEFCTGDALVFPDERITYPELAKLTNQYAKALIGLGVGRLEKVGIHMAAGIDYLALLLAILKAGAVAVPINGRFKERELRHTVTATDIKVLFTSSDTREFIDYAALLLSTFPSLSEAASDSGSRNEVPKLTHVFCFSGDVPSCFLTRDDFKRAAEHVSDLELQCRRAGVRIRDTAILLLTSGTTAQPKAAMLSHEALYHKATTVRDTWWMLTSSDRIWTVLPLFHIGGISYSFTCFSAGATLCHSGFFKPEVALQQMAAEKCTIALPAFETIWLAILNHSKFHQTDLSRLRLTLVVGVREQLLRMQEILPHSPQVATFGSTEAIFALTAVLPTDPLETRLTSCGYPMRGMEMRVVDPESGALLGPSQRGEIQFRGPAMFDGYYNDPVLTRQVIDEQGWFHSGDLGELDKDGRIMYKGRLKDMLKVGGENVAAIEIEDYLQSHRSIQIVQVVAAPDSRYVEVPAAYVQLKDGTTATEEELINFCLGQIATFKVPRYVRFVTEWPMSGTKIQKFVLRQRIAEELKQAGITEAPKLQSKDARKEVQ